MVEHGGEVIDSIEQDTIGHIRLEEYDEEKYDVEVSIGHYPISQGDIVLTLYTDSFGVIAITPRDIKIVREEIDRLDNQDIEEDVGTDIMCRFCEGCHDNGSLVSCVYTIVHLSCLGELFDGANELVTRNKELIISTEL